MTGLVSNMDTDTIVKELMSVQNQKKVKIENKITLNEWTTERWEALNSKIKSFHTGILTRIKTQGQYKAKNATSSNESKLSVSAGMNAVNGSYSIKVNKLATSQSMTSAQIPDITNADGTTKAVGTSTKLTELGNGWGAGTTINIKNGDKEVKLDVTADTTVSDFINASKSAGLTASFDASQKRIFLSSNKSGAQSNFSVYTSSVADPSIITAKDGLRNQLGYSSASSANRAAIDSLLNTFVSEDWGTEAQDTAFDKLNKHLDNATTTNYVNQLKTDWEANSSTMDSAAKQAMDNAAAAAEQKYRDGLAAGQTADPDKIKTLRSNAAAKAASDYTAQQKSDFDAGIGNTSANPYYNARLSFQQNLDAYKTLNDNLQSSGTTIESKDSIADSDAKLKMLGLVTVSAGVIDPSSTKPTGMGFVEAADSIVEYNGALIQSSTNEVSVNNLTLNLKGETAVGETISVTVSNNTDGIYDMVKEFVKGYNEILKDLNDNYNAKSSRGYDPLTSEQKEAMTEEEVKKWENKIKDSLLRRDDKVSGILSVMRNTLQGNVTVNGKRYSLASFGIGSPLYTEKGLLHIDGDQEDALRSGNSDKLKKAINQDPEAVMTVITTLTSNLYNGLKDKMKTNSMSSSMTFYNDKQMTKDLDNYKKELKKMEDKLADMEDKYYKQFSAMETALSKLNSQSNSLNSIVGFN